MDSVQLPAGSEVNLETTNRKELRWIMKNVIVLGIVTLITYTPQNGLERLQSTWHQEEGMGVINLSIVYTCFVISCLFLPCLVISILGEKWTTCACEVGYIMWLLANGYPRWETMVPASLILGLCAGPRWASHSSYVTKLGSRYASISNEEKSAVMSRFFGISFSFYQSSSILGSIVAYAILNHGKRNQTDPGLMKFCGAKDCPWHNMTTAKLKLEPHLIWPLLGTYLTIAVIGLVMMATLLDRLPAELRNKFDKKECGSETVKHLRATLSRLKDMNQLLLLPMTVYAGLEQSYYTSDFTKSFIGCPLGTYMVGLILFPAFLTGGIVALGSGMLVKYTGRIPLFLTGFVIDFTHQMVMRLWQPDPDKLYVFFLMGCCWGASQGIWQSQLNGLYGYVFRDTPEAAFASYRLWDSIGSAIGYGWSNFLCTWQKMYILTSVLCIGILGYLSVEFLLKKQKSVDIADKTISTNDSKDSYKLKVTKF